MFWVILGYFGGVYALLRLVMAMCGIRDYTATITADSELYTRYILPAIHFGGFVQENGRFVKVGVFINLSEWCVIWVRHNVSTYSSFGDFNTTFYSPWAPEIKKHITRVMHGNCAYTIGGFAVDAPIPWQLKLADKIERMRSPSRGFVMLLCGRPGIGKSSFASYILTRDVSNRSKSILILQPNQIANALCYVNDVVLIEEIDTMGEKTIASDTDRGGHSKAAFNLFMDIRKTLPNKITIMTSNKTPEELRKKFGASADAMFRPGRVDLIEWVDTDVHPLA